MKPIAVVLIVSLSNQGHWFGGQPGTVTVRPAVIDDGLDARLYWELYYAGARVTFGQVAVLPGTPETHLTVRAPQVRVPVEMRWVYKLRRRADRVIVAEGGATITVHPPTILAGLGRRLKDQPLIVCDRVDGLPKVLSAADIPFTLIDGGSGSVQKLQAAPVSRILVGPDELLNTPFGQTALLNQARAGSDVVVFAQSRAERLLGYEVRARPRPAKLEWRDEHLLLAGLSSSLRQSWVDHSGPDLLALQLPVDEPALEIAYWSREVPGKRPVPIDALLVVRREGAGRLVLCQLPLGPWDTDPRSQMVVRNALNYLLARAEPTPRPSERRPTPRKPEHELRTIVIPPGVKS